MTITQNIAIVFIRSMPSFRRMMPPFLRPRYTRTRLVFHFPLRMNAVQMMSDAAGAKG